MSATTGTVLQYTPTTAVDEIHRRLTAADHAGTQCSTEAPLLLVVRECQWVLRDPAFRHAVERVAMLARATNVHLDLRGRDPFATLELFGNLRHHITTSDRVVYRCLQPLDGYPTRDLRPGKTRIRHRDLTLTARGLPDTGVWLGGVTSNNPNWCTVRWDGSSGGSIAAIVNLDVELDRRTHVLNQLLESETTPS